MIIKRGTELRVNLGSYEHAIFRADIEFDTDDTGTADDVGLALAQELLDQALLDDITEARRVTTFKDSFIHDWNTYNDTRSS